MNMKKGGRRGKGEDKWKDKFPQKRVFTKVRKAAPSLTGGGPGKGKGFSPIQGRKKEKGEGTRAEFGKKKEKKPLGSKKLEVQKGSVLLRALGKQGGGGGGGGRKDHLS